MLTAIHGELIPVLNLYCPDFSKKFDGMINSVAAEFADRLAKHNIGQKGFKRGIEKLKARSASEKWTPTPEEFAQMCKPTAQDLGLPTLDQTIAEIIKRYGRYRTEDFEYSHRLVELVASDCGYFVTRESSEKFERRARASHTKWVKKAQLEGFPAKIPALELKVEQTPVFENKTAVNPFQARIDALRQKAKDEKQGSIKLTQEKIVSSRGAA